MLVTWHNYCQLRFLKPFSFSSSFSNILYSSYTIRIIHEYSNRIYNIAFVNSERWLAKSRVDITQCQHGKFPAAP